MVKHWVKVLVDGLLHMLCQRIKVYQDTLAYRAINTLKSMKMKQANQIFILPLLMTTIITTFSCKKNEEKLRQTLLAC